MIAWLRKRRQARRARILAEHDEQWGKVVAYLISEYDDAMTEAGVNRTRREAIRSKALAAVKKFTGFTGW